MSAKTEAAVVRDSKTIRACAGIVNDGYGGIMLIWRDIPRRRVRKAMRGKK